MNKFSCFLLLGLLMTSFLGCSDIPENHDPVIGIWSQTEVKGSATFREEWIFNDAYLGRYQQYESDELILKTDFTWQVKNSIYTLSYPGLSREQEQVKIIKNEEDLMLKTLAGETLASRE